LHDEEQTMTECKLANQVGAYHDGELLPPARDSMESHLANCPACAAELARLRQLSQMLRTARRPALPAQALDRLHRSVDLQPRITVLHMAEAFTAAAAAVLLISIVGLFELSTTQKASAQTPAWETVVATSSDSPTAAQDPSALWIDEVLSGKSGQ
jgi:anti-sigma factor RsiW